MMKLKPKRFGIRFGLGKSRSRSNNSDGRKAQQKGFGGNSNISETKWEIRPGGMLVQRRQESAGEDLISIRVSTFARSHLLSVDATSTFGELKMVLSPLTGLEPKEQRLLFRGREREECEHLHMVGVGDRDKVFLLQPPPLVPLAPTPVLS
ncbi:PREDICTED: BAG family molecular chaperone regulator 4 [Tarenaya hassleriana]|uniref:BAG family molecular chaperone regulator 4 n=1 Tax=Tarenaya hassleriana TaxID=28532 RepID=UPI00053CA2AA|nr:PREDICTED: BAG family molecular chaperone regulator 4 [Tarenaya hassleriana]XP_010550177.1 PREDICTED: BAG family molecular chaperone regulator 4 [Tarenaya hassleriana]